MRLLLIFLLAFSFSSLFSNPLKALYNSLDVFSLSEVLAFYELYPESDEAEKALSRAEKLLNIPYPDWAVCLPKLINRISGVSATYSEEEVTMIETLASQLPNRKLKGYCVKSESEIISLPSKEIDLGKALILSQMGDQENAYFQARSYSAMLDLMALQILARLPNEASALEKIQETNRFIFDQMHFRFPPHSVYAENIDLYTFLPSVMDNHLGVCLGVTALYLAIAQRLDLPLEIVTPPGHIYIRHRENGRVLNIETTARGVHMPDETYLSVTNFELPERTIKEVIGMTHVNQASTYLHKGEFQKAAFAYQKACPYMPKDPLVHELLGYSYLLIGKQEEGEELLRGIEKGFHSIAEDYLAGKVGLDGIQAVFMLVDETRESILEKQTRLKNILEKYPRFRDGLHQLAVGWIQLNRAKEAIETLTKLHALDASDAVTEYYLAVLHGQRHDFKKCWLYLKNAEEILASESIMPKALKELRRELILHCPE